MKTSFDGQCQNLHDSITALDTSIEDRFVHNHELATLKDETYWRDGKVDKRFDDNEEAGHGDRWRHAEFVMRVEVGAWFVGRVSVWRHRHVKRECTDKRTAEHLIYARCTANTTSEKQSHRAPIQMECRPNLKVCSKTKSSTKPARTGKSFAQEK